MKVPVYRFTFNRCKRSIYQAFHSKVQVAVGRFRNFFYMLFFNATKKTY